MDFVAKMVIQEAGVSCASDVFHVKLARSSDDRSPVTPEQRRAVFDAFMRCASDEAKAKFNSRRERVTILVTPNLDVS